MKLTVYHGSNQVIDCPSCCAGRKPVDFGQGFYVTDVKAQAIEWAKRIAENRGGTPILNVYCLDKDALLAEGRCKVFDAYNEEWLDFVVKNRQQQPIAEYDYIEGGVANDRIIDTVRLYMLGLMTMDVALQRLVMVKPNNQICLKNQQLLNKYLTFNGYENI